MVKLSMKVADEDQYDELEDQKRSLHAKLIQERGKARQMDDLISLSGMSVYSENGLMLNQVSYCFEYCQTLGSILFSCTVRAGVVLFMYRILPSLANFRFKYSLSHFKFLISYAASLMSPYIRCYLFF